ncbi:hypothetical protein FDUTEX481_06771 [Tolypothrix sp. PCC 7601]|nr:hypothetical protein FDUTEX481_06771 [Tolypothrix sp. PCC 7601]
MYWFLNDLSCVPLLALFSILDGVKLCVGTFLFALVSLTASATKLLYLNISVVPS